MGRKHKFTKFVIHTDDEEHVTEGKDYNDPCPVKEERSRIGTEWASMQDQVANEEERTFEEQDECITRKESSDEIVDKTCDVDSIGKVQLQSVVQTEREGNVATTDCTPKKCSMSEREACRTPEKTESPPKHATKAGAATKADQQQTPRRSSSEREHRAHSQRWQELAAEAAAAEIEAMHWDQAGSSATAAECYCQVAVKLLQAAESLDKDQAVRQVLEQRATDALERVASLEASESIAKKEPLHKDQAKLTTQGILASTLASTAGTAESDDPLCKSSLRLEDAKVLGTAATLGGAAGMLLMGPLSAAAFGASAAFATTKDDVAGAAARKVCMASMGVADSAMNKAVGTGLKAAEFALEEGRRRLLEGINSSPNASKPSLIMDWCRANKDKCIRAVAAVEALQRTLPRRRLCEEARRMKTRYPDRVPVLCERCAGARSDLPDMERNKFAVPDSMLFGEFKYIVHKQITQSSRGLPVDETIYLFVGESGVQPRTSAMMGDLYKLHGTEDSFLYVRYTAENTLG